MESERMAILRCDGKQLSITSILHQLAIDIRLAACLFCLELGLTYAIESLKRLLMLVAVIPPIFADT